MLSNPGPATGIGPIDREISTSCEWIDDFQKRLDWRDRTVVYLALKAAFHALRDALPPEEAVFLGASLPLLLRGAYFEGWHMRDGLSPLQDREALLERIRDGVNRALGVDAEQAARTMFELLDARLPPAELEDVKAATPSGLHFLWPAGAA
jgi:uncharacterized protein (DUF2267 family)